MFKESDAYIDNVNETPALAVALRYVVRILEDICSIARKLIWLVLESQPLLGTSETTSITQRTLVG